VGKVRQIFIWNGQQDFGPFRREELVERLKAGAVLPSHYYFEQGMTGWERVARLPCCQKFLATDPQKQMLYRMGVKYDEFPTKADVSSILENQPATDRQLALLKYLGLPAPVSLTKINAAELIDNARRDPSFGDRFDQWAFDRLEARPDLYASERNAYKAGRASTLLTEYEQFRRDMRHHGCNFPKLTLGEIEEVITKPDKKNPGWDREILLTGVDYLLAELEKDGRISDGDSLNRE
jgi:GYF domain 2